uniref:Uncharacterized protein n=1 Tax=Rhizophora mucronata TaxID=61149 RepID=A0A2P2IYG1_RHIMU
MAVSSSLLSPKLFAASASYECRPDPAGTDQPTRDRVNSFRQGMASFLGGGVSSPLILRFPPNFVLILFTCSKLY